MILSCRVLRTIYAFVVSFSEESGVSKEVFVLQSSLWMLYRRFDLRNRVLLHCHPCHSYQANTSNDPFYEASCVGVGYTRTFEAA